MRPKHTPTETLATQAMGVMAHSINSLKECNAALKPYGPANFKKDRITVKTRPGQETEVTRSNFKLASMSGLCIIWQQI